MKGNLSNCSYSFSLLNVNFENITIGFYVLIIFFIFAKFQENQRSIALLSIKYLRLCLVAAKHFPENTYFSKMLISGKGKCFHVFCCISKNFPENIFWCLEKKKENKNPEKHKPQPRKKSSTTTNPVRRPPRRSRSRLLREIAIDGAISRSVDHDLGSSSLAYIRDLAISDLPLSPTYEISRSWIFLSRHRSRSRSGTISRWRDRVRRFSSCARVRSLSLSLSFSGNALKGK